MIDIREICCKLIKIYQKYDWKVFFRKYNLVKTNITFKPWRHLMNYSIIIECLQTLEVFISLILKSTILWEIFTHSH